MNRRYLFVFLALLLTRNPGALAQAMTEDLSGIDSDLPDGIPDGRQWQLVFNDEFNGPELDRDKWKVYGDGEAMPRRDGFWTADALHIDTSAGTLVMRTYREDGRYFDGCIHTDGTFETTYGYFECRAQLHRQEGHWPAFWLWTGAMDRVGEGGKNGAELDIFEKFKTNRKVWHNIHWDGYGESHASAGKRSRHRKIMRGFHTYGLWWSPGFYRFYVDGKMVWETMAGGICSVPLHLLLSDEVGRHKRMRRIEKADLPDEWVVDHVRVWRLQ
jgi:beta-glucanase (GH16 family)